MDPEHQLQHACRQWRRLAEAEGHAIRNGDWSLVLDCQNALRQLQTRIDSLADDARQHWARLGPTGDARRRALHTLALELIETERRNLESLNLRRRSLLAQRDRLDQASRNLRHIQRSYAAALPSASSLLSSC